jgi:hypothetical protein
MRIAFIAGGKLHGGGLFIRYPAPQGFGIAARIMLIGCHHEQLAEALASVPARLQKPRIERVASPCKSAHSSRP